MNVPPVKLKHPVLGVSVKTPARITVVGFALSNMTAIECDWKRSLQKSL